MWVGFGQEVISLSVLSAQGSIHSTAEFVGKHLHSTDSLKRILPRCTASQPASYAYCLP